MIAAWGPAGWPMVELWLGWADFVARECLLFAAIWFLLGAIDDLGVDLIWIWHRLRGRTASPEPTATSASPPLENADPARYAVLIPAWHEADVIGAMIGHCLVRWPTDRVRLYIGTYPNDPETALAVVRAAGADRRVRLVTHQRPGPTSKADCLNAIWRAMLADEAAQDRRFHAVVLHDAEDLVHPDALGLFDRWIGSHEFVQLPVIPLRDPGSRWIAGHYCDEFAESHGKAMVVRDRLAVGLPAAGVGCAFARRMMAVLAHEAAARGADGPFAADSLTEDYELGLRIHRHGGRGVFVRSRGAAGDWIATRSYFPGTLGGAVRQKSRWMIGIALSGWDRLGWAGSLAEHWMRLRDRRAVLAALVLVAAYAALLIGAAPALAAWLGWYAPRPIDPGLRLLLAINLAALGWRLAMRVGFTTLHYGWIEGFYAAPRLVIGNIIAIMAARRALTAYVLSLGGRPPRWDKTDHAIPPLGESPEAIRPVLRRRTADAG